MQMHIDMTEMAPMKYFTYGVSITFCHNILSLYEAPDMMQVFAKSPWINLPD